MLTKEEIDLTERLYQNRFGAHDRVFALIAYIREQDAALTELRAENARLTSEDETLMAQLERQAAALAEARETIRFYASVEYRRYSARMNMRLTHSDAEADSGQQARNWLKRYGEQNGKS